MIKKNQKDMQECDKRKGQTSSKLHMIYISSNNFRHPVGNSVGKRTPAVRYTTRNIAYFSSLYKRWHWLNKRCRIF